MKKLVLPSLAMPPFIFINFMEANLMYHLPFYQLKSDDIIRSKYFSMTVNSNWISCGMDGVYNYIKDVLGFNYMRECAAYCFDNSLYQDYFPNKEYYKVGHPRFEQTRNWILNNNFRTTRVVQPLLPNLTPNDVLVEKPYLKMEPRYFERYRDFLTALFIHITTIDGWMKSNRVNYKKDGIFTREEFINLWRLNAGLEPIDLNTNYTQEQLDEQNLPGSSDYRKNIAAMKNAGNRLLFETKVSDSWLKHIENYLTEYRIRNSSLYGSGNNLVDAINSTKNYFITSVLTESNYGYLSGNDFNLEVGTPIAKLSAGVATGSFYVFHKSTPRIRYKIGYYGVTASLGLSINFPININLSFASFPSIGKIFNGFFRSISDIKEFAGSYIVIGANAGIFANITTSLLFIGRNPINPTFYKQLSSMIDDQILDYTFGGIPLMDIFGARAVVSLDGQAFQLLAGGGASIATGHLTISKAT